jgi:hypothetical protein
VRGPRRPVPGRGCASAGGWGVYMCVLRGRMDICACMWVGWVIVKGLGRWRERGGRGFDSGECPPGCRTTNTFLLPSHHATHSLTHSRTHARTQHSTHLLLQRAAGLTSGARGTSTNTNTNTSSSGGGCRSGWGRERAVGGGVEAPRVLDALGGGVHPALPLEQLHLDLLFLGLLLRGARVAVIEGGREGMKEGEEGRGAVGGRHA